MITMMRCLHTLFGRGTALPGLVLLFLAYSTTAFSADWETSRPDDVEAFKRGDLIAVKKLFAHDANYLSGSSLIKTALFYSISSGNLELLQYLQTRGWFETCRQLKGWKKGEPFNRYADPQGCYPVAMAASQGNIEIIKYLMTQGFDVKEADKRGKTALHAAVESGHVGAVRFLCEQGLDPNLKGGEASWTALQMARDNTRMTYEGTGRSPNEIARQRADDREILAYLESGQCRGK